MVDVVRKPHGDASVDRAGESPIDDRRERVGQPDVVDRDLERAAGGREPVGERVCDFLRRLPAVGEGPDG
jgi:hypothetical protein